MKALILLLLIIFTFQLETIEPTIITVKLSDLNCEDDKSLKFSLIPSLPNDIKEDENITLTLVTSDNQEKNKTCTIINDNNSNQLKCPFTGDADTGIYYIKKITSKTYIYVLNIPSSVFFRIGQSECDPKVDFNGIEFFTKII